MCFYVNNDSGHQRVILTENITHWQLVLYRRIRVSFLSSVSDISILPVTLRHKELLLIHLRPIFHYLLPENKTKRFEHIRLKWLKVA